MTEGMGKKQRIILAVCCCVIIFNGVISIIERWFL